MQKDVLLGQPRCDDFDVKRGIHPGDICAKEGKVSRIRVAVHSLEGGHHLLSGGAEDPVFVGELGDGINYPGEDLGQLGIVCLGG